MCLLGRWSVGIWIERHRYSRQLGVILRQPRFGTIGHRSARAAESPETSRTRRPPLSAVSSADLQRAEFSVQQVRMSTGFIAADRIDTFTFDGVKTGKHTRR